MRTLGWDRSLYTLDEGCPGECHLTCPLRITYTHHVGTGYGPQNHHLLGPLSSGHIEAFRHHQRTRHAESWLHERLRPPFPFEGNSVSCHDLKEKEKGLYLVIVPTFLMASDSIQGCLLIGRVIHSVVSSKYRAITKNELCNIPFLGV
jgi:hypothetical protein